MTGSAGSLQWACMNPRTGCPGPIPPATRTTSFGRGLGPAGPAFQKQTRNRDQCLKRGDSEPARNGVPAAITGTIAGAAPVRLPCGRLTADISMTALGAAGHGPTVGYGAGKKRKQS